MNNEILKDLADVARFFMVSSEFKESVTELQAESDRFEKMCGLYKSVKQVERAVADLEKEKTKLAGLKEEAQKSKDACETEREHQGQTIGDAIREGVAELTEELEAEKEALADQLRKATDDRKEAREYLETLKSEHETRESLIATKEKELTRREQEVDSAEDAAGKEKARLKEVSEKMSRLV